MPSKPSIDQLYTSIDQGPVFGFILRDPPLPISAPRKTQRGGAISSLFCIFLLVALRSWYVNRE